MRQSIGPILIDAPGDAAMSRTFLEDLGHPVIVCHGPPHGTLCPILVHGSCPKAEHAHGILFLLDLDRAQHRAILKKYQVILDDDVPIRVVVSPEQAVDHAELLRGIQVWTHLPGIGDLDGFAAEVEAAEQFV